MRYIKLTNRQHLGARFMHIYFFYLISSRGDSRWNIVASINHHYHCRPRL